MLKVGIICLIHCSKEISVSFCRIDISFETITVIVPFSLQLQRLVLATGSLGAATAGRGYVRNRHARPEQPSADGRRGQPVYGDRRHVAVHLHQLGQDTM